MQLRIGRVQVGAVVFVQDAAVPSSLCSLHGCEHATHTYQKIWSVLGEDRVDLLARVFLGRVLPHDLYAVAWSANTGRWPRVTADEIEWFSFETVNADVVARVRAEPM